jgi:pyridoxal phosphate enzyme (YggS family)
MKNIQENVKRILETVNEACAKAGRTAADIEIIAASKTRTAAEIKALWETGEVKIFGENRVQELLEKYDPALQWDFIGRLQTNKVKYIVGRVRLIHSADRLSLMQEIDRIAGKAGRTQDVLIEVNTGDEENKGGVSLAEVERFAAEIARFPHVRLKGLMAVAPLVIEKSRLKDLFLGVHQLFCGLRKRDKNIEYLSMGMSGDYPLAIECGANQIRLGRILFE